MGKSTKNATATGAVLGVSHTKMSKRTAIVGKERNSATTGRINAANGLNATARHAQPSASAKDIKNATSVRNRLADNARQKNALLSSVKNSLADWANGATKNSFLTTAPTISHTAHIKIIAEREYKILNFLSLINFFISIEEAFRGSPPYVV